MITRIARDVPLIADADVGFGGPAQVARTVERYAQVGVAALHIEDQVRAIHHWRLSDRMRSRRSAAATFSASSSPAKPSS